MNYVIIGNGTAAVGTIEGIRAVDQKGTITVISEEPYHVYGRSARRLRTKCSSTAPLTFMRKTA